VGFDLKTEWISLEWIWAIFGQVSKQDRTEYPTKPDHWRLGRKRFGLRTPPLPHLLPCHPLRTPLGQVLSLGDQTLMNRAGEQGDAVSADLVAEVLAGDADRTRAGGFQEIPLQVIPLLWVGQSGRGGHRSKARTPALVATRG